MLRFLFGGRKNAETKPETQRETFTRLATEMNDLIAAMAEKPKVTIDPNSGEVTFDLPETLPDEALALPAPEEAEAVAEKTDAADEASPSEITDETSKEPGAKAA